jgi:aquaporin Z
MLRRAAAEFFGVFFIVFAAVLASWNLGPGGLAEQALANGMVVTALIAGLAGVSGGHFNPAVTAALLASKKIRPGAAAAYAAAQFAGGFAACLFLLAMGLGPRALAAGTPRPGADAAGQPLGFLPVLLAETAATFLLMMVIYGAAVDRKGAGPVAGLAIGFAVAVDIISVGTISGGAMNPARYLAPSALSGVLFQASSHAWVYFAGPLAGALLAAAAYQGLFRTKDSE